MVATIPISRGYVGPLWDIVHECDGDVMPETEPGAGSSSEDIGAKTSNEKRTVASCAAVPTPEMNDVRPTYTNHVEDRRC